MPATRFSLNDRALFSLLSASEPEMRALITALDFLAETGAHAYAERGGRRFALRHVGAHTILYFLSARDGRPYVFEIKRRDG